MALNVPVSQGTKTVLDSLKPFGTSYDRLVRWILETQKIDDWKEYLHQEAWRAVALAEVRRGRRLNQPNVSLPTREQTALADAAGANWRRWQNNPLVRKPAPRYYQVQSDPNRQRKPVDALREVRPALSAGRPLEAQLFLAAAVSELAATIGLQATLTGDVPVAFYTASTVVPPGSSPSAPGAVLMATNSLSEAAEIGRLLERYGFQRTQGSMPLGRNQAAPAWKLPDVPILVAFTGQAYLGDWSRHVTIDLDQHRLRMRGPEDSLWEHLEWGAVSTDQHSWARALAILAAQSAELDQPYLSMLARFKDLEADLKLAVKGKPLA